MGQRAGPWALLTCVLLAQGLAGQQSDSIPGVSLSLDYQAEVLPVVAVLPISAESAEAPMARMAESIIARDLLLSNRFEVIDSLPEGLATAGADYGLWDQLNADWLVSGELRRSRAGVVFSVVLHDVVRATERRAGRFLLTDPKDDGFRMSVHTVSDAVTRWVTGEPGMAASRVVFSMRPDPRAVHKEIHMVDSDGENLVRLTFAENTVASPAWSLDGARIAYVSWKSGMPRIYIVDAATGEEEALDPGREGQQITPSFHPNGRSIAFAILDGARSGLFTWDFREKCCLVQLSGGRYLDLQPTYSHDGSRFAFTSSRLGTAHPQIYTRRSDGRGESRLLSPHSYGNEGYFTDPDWSPARAQVAFSGRIGRRSGRYHILVAEPERAGRIVRLTEEGDNQDPSWAPDGRHIVFTGERSYGYGIFVVDSRTGKTRLLVPNVRAEDTEWSPSLARAPMASAFGVR